MIDALTREKIEELQGLAARATPGPWRAHLVDDTTFVAENGFEIGSTWPGGGVDADKDFVSPVEQHEQNAALIVAMRNALPALLDVASSTLTADAGDGELIARERDNARAECSWLANSLLKYRSDLKNIAHDIEDEGDRYYFGSTNDADLLKEIVEKIENYGFNRITRASKWPDYIRQSAKAHARAESAEARATASESEAAKLRERVGMLEKALEFYGKEWFWGEADADGVVRLRPTNALLVDKGLLAETAINPARARTALEGRDDE